MKKCTKIDNANYTNEENIIKDEPLVSILLAVYKPNEKWLIEQLISLNEQSYRNLNLYIYDDSPQSPIDEEIIKKNISFDYFIIRGKENKGSNHAFEVLTQAADGDYFAYCDQDDIWEKDKISLIMKSFMNDDKINLVYSDLSIIDENGIKKYDSLKKIRKRIIYKSGYNLVKDLLISNFVTGCSMIVKKEIALRAIPFQKYFIHDQWIAIVASINGKIEVINSPLVRYRQHAYNQTGILTGIFDKDTYIEKRINLFAKRYNLLKIRFSDEEELIEYFNTVLDWLEAREEYLKKPSIKCLKVMIKYRNIHKISILIETFLPFIPNFIFKLIIKMAKKGLL